MMKALIKYLHPQHIRQKVPQRIRDHIPASFKSLLPAAAREPNRYQAYAWRRLTEYPKRITQTRLLASGCTFEVLNANEQRRAEWLAGEEAFIRLLLDAIQPGDVYYDVGSCIGMHALHAALLHAHVIAFEPDPYYRRRLVRNVRLNKLQRKIHIIPWAVSDQAGKVPFYIDKIYDSSSGLLNIGKPDAKTTYVRADTLERIIAAKQLPAPDLIKIDIEGAEILALRGMHRLLHAPDAPRALFIELHPTFLTAFGSSLEECRALIESAGYISTYCEQRNDQWHYVYHKKP
jgi:FkbM family methyltransferase